ncbi:hypothetical protein ABFU84_20230 [Xanthomonas translucens pv. undulosa]|uniref:hypothetical protein n=1 Tax=Xanthomonas campestris pv. translucens TaxID=343 RepID=UPI003CED3911
MSASPADAIKVRLNVELKHGEDHCKLGYFYVNKSGHENWFSPSGAKMNGEIMGLIIELRKYFRENALFKKGSPWVGLNIIIDVNESKIFSNFIYE